MIITDRWSLIAIWNNNMTDSDNTSDAAAISILSILNQILPSPVTFDLGIITDLSLIIDLSLERN